jgi:uncharacterized protein (DUF305 family)
MKATVLAIALILASGGASAMAQDDATTGLPAICAADASMDHAGNMSMGGGMAAGDEAHQALMAGMDQMNAEMMAGGTAKDIDVAFACAMIPHHRGAISMAKAELEHGDDAWARGLAEQIIAAQEKEIADILAWLEQQAQ